MSHIFQQMHCRIGGLDSTLLYQVALTGVSCPASGMDLLQQVCQHLAPLALKKVISSSVHFEWELPIIGDSKNE